MDAEAEQIREVYAYYGAAMFHAQVLERQIAMLLATVFRRVKTQEEYDRELEANFQKTLGKLVNELLRLGASETLMNDLALDLRLALETRNMLAHKFFWQRAATFITFDGRTAMLAELNQFMALFIRLDGVLTGLTDAWAAKHGLTNELLTKGQPLPPD